jgi:hypothetical protein
MNAFQLILIHRYRCTSSTWLYKVGTPAKNNIILDIHIPNMLNFVIIDATHYIISTK